MSLPVLNTELLRDLVTWAAADDKQDQALLARFAGWGDWDQDVWVRELRNGVCQSAYCIAGQAALQVGYDFVFPDYSDYTNADGARVFTSTTVAPKVFQGLDSKGKPVYDLGMENQVYITDVAKKALGIDEGEADALFRGGNSISHVVDFAMAFAEVRGVDLGLDAEIVALRNDRIDGVFEQYLRYHPTYRDYLRPTCDTCGQALPQPVEVPF